MSRATAADTGSLTFFQLHICQLGCAHQHSDLMLLLSEISFSLLSSKAKLFQHFALGMWTVTHCFFFFNSSRTSVQRRSRRRRSNSNKFSSSWSHSPTHIGAGLLLLYPPHSPKTQLQEGKKERRKERKKERKEKRIQGKKGEKNRKWKRKSEREEKRERKEDKKVRA